MFRPIFAALLLLLVALACPIRADDDKAAPAAQKPAKTSADAAKRKPSPDFKVVFWLSGSGLKHQVYDVRKGQYTKAVDDWVHEPEIDRSGYAVPGRLATVRDVYLGDDPGKTESEKLAEAIDRHERRILGIDQPRKYERVTVYPPLSPYVETRSYVIKPRYGSRPPGASYAPFAPLGASYAPSSPFPVPYPRPHP